MSEVSVHETNRRTEVHHRQMEKKKANLKERGGRGVGEKTEEGAGLQRRVDGRGAHLETCRFTVYAPQNPGG